MYFCFCKKKMGATVTYIFQYRDVLDFLTILCMDDIKHWYDMHCHCYPETYMYVLNANADIFRSLYV